MVKPPIVTLDESTLDRVIATCVEGRVMAALLLTWQAMAAQLGHDSIEQWARSTRADGGWIYDVEIPDAQHERIVQGLLTSGDALAAVNRMLTWLDYGPSHQGDTT